ncbi:LSU ribosomal protein L23P [Draconibacterium orientale]|jgi:large subunit ribosomal protein L23|uniref:Large ribosomal subunit protein uL23 n=1 Tax=Draconibacterium orientale TaxID=1168034 RepID=X5E0W8_9BACT|nr:50S ribosomal protein L23 [Draconibacterium orientale]AHW60201.1 50S ribosomal protein L23 [Draconibacterium orientale]SES96179.1 LSU ribosomal protein L23P [Draconibacterium orientale]
MEILVKPLVTEKMTDQSERFNRYGFVVARNASKPEIKKAVENLYNVSVESVNTMVYGGKVKSRYTKGGIITGKTAAYKKAIVTLVEGDSIDFYSNI